VGGTRGVVRDGVGMLPDDSAMAGSVATMIQIIKNMVRSVGVSLPEAVRMASLNPARALGLGGRKGSIEPRKDADLTIFTAEFKVEKTLIAGRVEYDSAGR
jgi:N-acetylglucosamine-6-phosphate deacetylase